MNDRDERNTRPLGEPAVERVEREGEVARMELLEERARVDVHREKAGHVELRREVRQRTEQVPVELTSEVLVIEALEGGPGVTIDGQRLEAGERREVILYDERVRVERDTVVHQEVHVRKQAENHTETVEVELGREELVVEPHDEVQHLVKENRTTDRTERTDGEDRLRR